MANRDDRKGKGRRDEVRCERSCACPDWAAPMGERTGGEEKRKEGKEVGTGV